MNAVCKGGYCVCTGQDYGYYTCLRKLLLFWKQIRDSDVNVVYQANQQICYHFLEQAQGNEININLFGCTLTKRKFRGGVPKQNEYITRAYQVNHA